MPDAIKKENLVHIVMITDDNYIMPTYIALKSMFENKKLNSKYKINILTNNILEKNVNILTSLSTTNFEINIINKTEIVDNIGSLNQERHVTPTAILKFFIPEIFKDLNKILYLDSDIIVQKDLSELYNIDIKDVYAGVIKDILSIRNLTHKNKLNMKSKFYFNSGVLLLNLDKMRTDLIKDKLVKYRTSKYNYFMDQDAFNAVLDDNVKYLSYKYNFLNYYLEKMSIKELSVFFKENMNKTEKDIYKNCTIIHLGGCPKPWTHNIGYLSDLYIKYAQNTPYEIDKKSLINTTNKSNAVILRQIFSIVNSNDKKHKILTLLGVKIKFRRKEYA